jgi:hypothetical protein
VGRRRQSQAAAIELLRSELLATRAELQSTLARVVGDLAARQRADEAQEHVQRALLAALEWLRSDAERRGAELVRALERVGETSALLAERIEADGAERRALADALQLLAAGALAAGTPALGSPGEQLIGGTVVAEREIDLTQVDAGDALDAIDPADAADGTSIEAGGVEVWCRFGDRWVGGFEVCEVVRDGQGVRYRLRRRSDGCALPTLFRAVDVRGAAPQDQELRGGWTRG